MLAKRKTAGTRDDKQGPTVECCFGQCLEQRAEQWNKTPQTRFLPSPGEYLQILLWAPRDKLTPGQRALLRAALARRYGAALAEAVATGRLVARAGGWAVPAPLRFVADEVLAWIEARAEARGFDRPSAHSVPSAACPSPPASAAGSAPTRT